MLWVAIEDTDTYEVSEFEKAAENQVLCLLIGYKVNMNNPTKFRVQDAENGKNIIYEGIIYQGGFGYNLWIGKKYVEV